jgi:CMP-N-acetylneuraminic acid synthetase
MSERDPNVVAIIPARGGSKGLPRKNVRLLAGKPLIGYTIEVAKQCPLIHRVIVSTDDAEIAQVARQFGAEVPFIRPAELAVDYASTESVLKHAVEWLEENEGYPVDIMVFLQPTDIFRKRCMLEAVVMNLLADKSVDSSFVVYPEHKNYWRKVGEEYQRIDRRGHMSRQLKEKIYREDTGLACATRGWIVKEGRRIGDKVVPVMNEDNTSFVDIHDEFDLWLAEKILTDWGRKIND